MYTYNLFIFGHKLPSNIVETLDNLDFQLSKTFDGISFDSKSHYHGSSNTTPWVFGHEITDDTDECFIEIVRQSQESKYEAAFVKFVDFFKKALEESKEDFESEEDFKTVFEYFENNNKPTFYLVQVSS